MCTTRRKKRERNLKRSSGILQENHKKKSIVQLKEGNKIQISLVLVKKIAQGNEKKHLVCVCRQNKNGEAAGTYSMKLKKKIEKEFFFSCPL
jgi:hypothetical protein